ncbi:uncharacterized protein LOC126413044 [Schistocerca serialis cubense]|uniref:uncharacterized protein LOC126413044 n=1 Tax=Schistocerca serialis cubense TaxID=2023355 RepID=UPI00214EAF3C|nr:uncharacterized protein LOC126413044 [Schistocerca serialis cubense]
MRWALASALNVEARWTLTVHADCGGEWSAEGAVLVVLGADVAATLEKLDRPVDEPQPLVLLTRHFRVDARSETLAAPRGVSRLLLVETSTGRLSRWAPHPCHGRLEPAPTHSAQLDMRGCPLVASTFVWPPYTLPAHHPRNATDPESDQTAHFLLTDGSFFEGGLEVRLAETLAVQLNAKLRYRVRMRDMWRGVVDDVSRRSAHIGFAGKWFVVMHPHLNITCTVPYHRGSFYWYVAAERPLARWQALWRAFAAPFWAALAAAFFGCACFIALLSKRRFRSGRRLMSAPLLKSWAVLLGCSTPLPTAGHALRLLLLSYVVFCMQVNTAYQAGLVSRLAHPGWERPVASLEQALSRGLSFVFPAFWKVYFQGGAEVGSVLQNMEDERYRRLVRRARLSDDVRGSLLATASRRDAAVAAADAFADYTMGAGHRKLRRLQEDVVRSFDVVMLLPKGSPLLPRINSLIGRLMAAGFFDRWWSDLSRRRWTTETGIEDTDGDENAEGDAAFSLSLVHAQGAFAALLAGWLLSLTVFALELAVHVAAKRKTATPTKVFGAAR